MSAPSKKRSREDPVSDASKRARTAKQQPSGPVAAAAAVAPKTDANGDPYWEISRMRRVTVSTFKGMTMVNVREYYEKDGVELPGKKGISMPVDQFNALIELLPGIEGAVQRKGGSLVRPEYAAAAAASAAGESDQEEEEDLEDEEGDDEGKQELNGDDEESEEKGTRRRKSSSESKQKRRPGGSGRQNIEATSDEDESE